MQHRNPEVNENKPNCMSEEIRKEWWKIAEQCSQRDPDARPSIEKVSSLLDSLSLLVPGIVIFILV